MKCPKCGAETKVIDSRIRESANSIWRRRECERCGNRETTYERFQLGSAEERIEHAKEALKAVIAHLD